MAPGKAGARRPANAIAVAQVTQMTMLECAAGPFLMAYQTHLVTADELAHLPDDDFRYELVEGRVVRMSPPGIRHGAIAVAICRVLDQHVTTHKLGIVVAESGFKLADKPDTVRGPDVAFVRRERIPNTGLPSGFWDGPPDLAVEILSPDDRQSDVRQKVEEYMGHGVSLVWVVDPERRTVTVHSSVTSPPRTVTEHQIIDGADVLQGFSCKVALIFD
jgi:Uma2 family endonuclease